MNLDKNESTMRVKKRSTTKDSLEQRRVAINYQQMTAPCGLDCFDCPLYLVKDNPGLRAKTAVILGLPSEKAFWEGTLTPEYAGSTSAEG